MFKRHAVLFPYAGRCLLTETVPILGGRMNVMTPQNVIGLVAVIHWIVQEM
ncbi:hypothetical protein BIFDEN_01645 [Bifidobacterium dentium ATCC 27678]|nr:hypothetical protein BIFDEN_01645 [Bifidobacterium dentium ATCC 27678]